MMRTIKKGNNRTKLVIVLSLVCSVFGLGVNAQTNSDKPLNAQQLANLKTGLKQVVQENLAVAEKYGKKYAAITKKWDARKDLTGKSKTQVIDLLYEDVKTVVTDSGMQYQISSVFSFYKQMPDEQFSDKMKATQTNSSKKESVEKLVDSVFMSHPYVNIEKQIENLPGAKSAQEADRKQRFEVFDDALKANKKLTPDQKAFVKANYDRLNKMVDEKLDTAMKLNYPTEQWVREGLDKIFAERFTVEEINNLTAFFVSDKGARVLNYVRQTNMEQLITGNGGKLDFTAADKAEHDKFIATALGKKFIAVYITETEADEQKKEGEVRSNIPNADGFALLEPASLNKFFNQFVADKYKK